jgi:dipeptide/tripeptide permease
MSAPAASDGVPPETETPSQSSSQSHPLGLYALFGTEMWERFSYYGMRALLVLYMVSYHGWLPREANSVYKWYTSLVYLAPLLGGFLADRFLGLRAAIVTGGVLMAVGHFLMAFEPIPIFYAALLFLIIGNGFFKPNISTMVGKLYPKGDARRDGAFTIFYMGINLGAGLAPLICGRLKQAYGFHAGFTAAGVGMGLGLVIFLVSQRRIARDIEAAGNSLAIGSKAPLKEQSVKATDASAYRDAGAVADLVDDDAKPGATGIAGVVSLVYPALLGLLGVGLPAYNAFRLATGRAVLKEVFMPTAFALIGAVMGFILQKRTKGAARDKSTVIFILFLFVVAFWFAFEQAGSTQNLWAEYFTNRNIPAFQYNLIWTIAYAGGGTAVLAIFVPAIWAYLGKTSIGPALARTRFASPRAVLFYVFCAIVAANLRGLVTSYRSGALTEYTAEEWQSANAFLIVILAPLFSAAWVWLAKRGREPSAPAKMGVALTLVALSFFAMVGAAMYENRSIIRVKLSSETLPGAAFVHPLSADEAQKPGSAPEKEAKIRAVFPDGIVPAEVPLSALPGSLAGKTVVPVWFNAGRTSIDLETRELVITGVFPQYEVNGALQAAVDREFVKALETLVEQSQAISAKSATRSVSVELKQVPAGFQVPATLTKVRLEGNKLIAEDKLNAPAKVALVNAGAPAEWRAALERARNDSESGRVPGFWLFLSYLLATLGELCLSPVGLSMVTKLAPSRFASLFMGVWLLGSSVAQYAGGAMGELWGEIAPLDYFRFFVGTSLIAALILFVLVYPVKRLMHNVA